MQIVVSKIQYSRLPFDVAFSLFLYYYQILHWVHGITIETLVSGSTVVPNMIPV